MIVRRKSNVVKIGRVNIGGSSPIAIQAMAKTATKNIQKVITELNSLVASGAEIVRVAVKDEADALAIKEIKKKVEAPVVADIHFNYRLALKAIDCGVDKIRLNPGNIKDKEELKMVALAVKEAKIPVRIGVNSGSILQSGSSRQKVNNLASTMVSSALSYARTLEGFGVDNLVISLKAEDVLTTIEAYRLISKKCLYPLHLGVTATGGFFSGLIKSSIGIGVLLEEGIGDTIRVSLTSSASDEIASAKNILQSLHLRNFQPEIISCPTCGRCQVDLISIVNEFENKLASLKYKTRPTPLKIAVMGCEVNGPGEARLADFGVAFGKNKAIVFDKGVIKGQISKDNVVKFLIKEAESRYAKS
jgi:(E)-4-hydroxy-3-methylbut-2-enyl-diphosphate synthase